MSCDITHETRVHLHIQTFPGIMSDVENFPLSITDCSGASVELGSLVKGAEIGATMRTRIANVWDVDVEVVDLTLSRGAVSFAGCDRSVPERLPCDSPVVPGPQLSITCTAWWKFFQSMLGVTPCTQGIMIHVVLGRSEFSESSEEGRV